MKQRQISRLLYLLMAFLALGLMSQCIGLGAAAPSASVPLPKQNLSYFLNNTWTISDFDGDNQPDLATSRPEGDSYKIEIQLSTRREKVSFSLLTKGELGIGLIACDVDRDNDKDLLIVSATSLQPLGVWLNDGHGHFERGDHRSRVNSLWSDDPLVYEHKNNSADQISISPNDRLFFDRSLSGFISPKLETKDSIRGESKEAFLQIPAYKLATRSPPHRDAL